MHNRGIINWKAFELMMQKISELEMTLMNEKLEDYQKTLRKQNNENIYEKLDEIEYEIEKSKKKLI